jgi:hypothetical protein
MRYRYRYSSELVSLFLCRYRRSSEGIQFELDDCHHERSEGSAVRPNRQSATDEKQIPRRAEALLVMTIYLFRLAFRKTENQYRC